MSLDRASTAVEESAPAHVDSGHWHSAIRGPHRELLVPRGQPRSGETVSGRRTAFGRESPVEKNPNNRTEGQDLQSHETIVCVCTRYDDPGRLIRCLASVCRQSEVPGALLVVVNRADVDIVEVRRHLATRLGEGPPVLTVIQEARVGIPYARNAAVATTMRGEYEFVAFIDDDEVAPQHWLEQHLRTLSESRSNVVTGPQVPIIPAERCSSLVARAPQYSTVTHPTGSLRGAASTGNVVVHRRVFEGVTPWFDEELAPIGGSDYQFFRRAATEGFIIRWNQRSEVYESYEPDQVSWRWLVARHFRYGVLEGWTVRDGRTYARAHLAGRGVLRIARGFGTMLRGIARRDSSSVPKGVESISAGVGRIAGSLRRFPRTYH